MGAVYEGINPQLGRRVAIKVLLSQFSNDKEQVARFFNEAKASNLVRHPSLVDVFECGYAENGTAFIIMEYLDGETLRTRCKRQGALGGAAIPIIRQMATALAATHEKNIVHRD
ncbi:MAG: protein kinase, partial [Myxococcales bacterium]|nr:protein kinase [Myxococcales bacterium]